MSPSTSLIDCQSAELPDSVKAEQSISPDDYKNKDLLNSGETAHWLGLKNVHTLEVWRSTKRYPELEYVRVGRCIRYRRKAIERFLEARTVSAEV